jgi:hypothetical protein
MKKPYEGMQRRKKAGRDSGESTHGSCIPGAKHPPVVSHRTSWGILSQTPVFSLRSAHCHWPVVRLRMPSYEVKFEDYAGWTGRWGEGGDSTSFNFGQSQSYEGV